VSVEKSNDDLLEEEQAKSLAAIVEGSWRVVGRWNARTADRVGEDLAGL
jgi:hypothetical protein